MKQRIKKLFKNSGIKVFCTIAATILWIYVAAGQNTIGKFPGSIKIKSINTPSGYEAIFDVKNADIKVMAEPSVWNKLSADSFSAYVDLSGRSEGVYELPVVVTCSIPGVSIVEVNPDRIMVRLEPIISKEVEIRSKVEGAAGDGLIAGTIALNPTSAIVRGAKSSVNNIFEGLAIIKLNGETESFEKNISLTASDEEGNELLGVQFDPPEVAASVAIVKASNNKTVGIKVQVTGQPKDGYYIAGISTNPNTIDIVGQPSLLANINYVESTTLDITNLDNTFEKDITLNLRSGISLQSGSPSSVKVKITISKIEVSKEIEASIVPIGLSAGYQVSSLNPIVVKAVCYGSADAINNLKTQDIVLSLDFNNRRFTEPAATVNFEISQSNFKVPAGIAIGSFSPSFISAVIEKN